MNEATKPGEGGTVHTQPEIVQTLIDKVADLGKSIREYGERIRRLPDPKETLEVFGDHIVKLEKAIDKENGLLKEVVSGLGRLSEYVTAPERLFGEMRGVLNSLSDKLREHKQFFEKPSRKEVHHQHFLGRPLLTIGGMSLLLCLLFFFWIRTAARLDGYAEHDIKWRYLKVQPQASISDFLLYMDSLYRIDPAGFTKGVTRKEDQREAEFKQWEALQGDSLRLDALRRGDKGEK